MPVCWCNVEGYHFVGTNHGALRPKSSRSVLCHSPASHQILSAVYATMLVVGQQPFGGARGSGTNDKAGSYLNLIRWVNARTIKENFVPPTDHRYPFLG